jgi:hypothetical protein
MNSSISLQLRHARTRGPVRDDSGAGKVRPDDGNRMLLFLRAMPDM